MCVNKKDENSAKNPLLCKNLTSLALFGLWPFQSEKFLKKKKLILVHFAFGFLIYCLNFLFLISEYIELYYVWGNLENMTTNMSVSCLTSVGVVKIYTFYGHRKKFKHLIESASRIETNILKYQSNRVKIILNDYVTTARQITHFFWTLTFSTILVFFIIPVIEYRISPKYHMVFENGTKFWSYTRPMVFSSWFPFDKFAIPNYYLAYVIQIIMGSIGASYHAIWDMFIVAMMIHSIGQLKILQRNLEDSATRYSLKDKISIRKLIDCVNHHRYIIRYTQDLNTILSPIMFLYFIVCSIMLCAIGFQAFLYGFSIRLCFMVEYLIAMIIQLFLFYWHGNEVIEESERLRFATYSCEWYKENKSFKTSLSIMREGIKIPIKFSVGKFYIMSLPTFVAILKASYSYFAVLQQSQEKT